jgi:hypothetical protein
MAADKAFKNLISHFKTITTSKAKPVIVAIIISIFKIDFFKIVFGYG